MKSSILLFCFGFNFLNCLPIADDIATSNDFQTQFVKKINEARSKGCRCGNTYMPPVDPIKWNDQLAQAAQRHANDMHKNDHFDHTGSDGSTIKDRIEGAGYKWRAIAENIAWGYTDVDAVVAGWLKSPGHCKNIMNGAYTEMGAAQAEEFWTQTFGRPR